MLNAYSVRAALSVMRKAAVVHHRTSLKPIANALSDTKSFPRSRYFVGAFMGNGPQ
jgi:hypothetical protein